MQCFVLKAFKKAWNEACSKGAILVVPNRIYRLKPITFSGPCQPNTAFMVSYMFTSKVLFSLYHVQKEFIIIGFIFLIHHVSSMEQSRHGLKCQHMKKISSTGLCLIVSQILKLMVVALSMAMAKNGGKIPANTPIIIL
jgi:hypothetical protein